MAHYAIQSIEGVGYLIFEMTNQKLSKRVGNVFQSTQQARKYLSPTPNDRVDLHYHCAYEEMINCEQGEMKLVLP